GTSARCSPRRRCAGSRRRPRNTLGTATAGTAVPSRRDGYKPTRATSPTGRLSAPALFAPHVATGSLQIVLPDWSAGVAPLYVVYPPNRHISAKLRVFIDWVADLFAGDALAPPTHSGSLEKLTPEGAADSRLM